MFLSKLALESSIFYLLSTDADANDRMITFDVQRIEVAYCVNAGYGTRVFPNGVIQGAHFTQTPDYVQVKPISVLSSGRVSWELKI